jgi:hypothetical protein
MGRHGGTSGKNNKTDFILFAMLISLVAAVLSIILIASAIFS